MVELRLVLDDALKQALKRFWFELGERRFRLLFPLKLVLRMLREDLRPKRRGP